jgi:6-phosphogluconolactonase (cycloisomerase 2 family)/PKD repeat protein
MTPDGAHLYAGIAGGSTVSVYNVNDIDGALSFQTSVQAGASPTALAVTPSGALLYSANSSGSVTRFAIAANGVPSQPQTTSVQGSNVNGVAVGPDGERLYLTYATAEGAGRVAVFAIGIGGALQRLDEADTGPDPANITVAPDGSRIYVANQTPGTISGFNVGSDGSLSELSGSPYAAGAGARSVSISPDGTRLLVANQTDSTVIAYTVDAAGALTSADSETLTGAGAVDIAPDNSHAYVAGMALVTGFELAADGTLTPDGEAIPTSGLHYALSVSPNIAPVSKFNVAVGPAGTPSDLDGRPSSDHDGHITKWTWDFGDGTTAVGETQSHVFVEPGNYTVRLTVTDNEGCTTAATYTGQTISCAGAQPFMQTIDVPPHVTATTPEPPCVHDGNDGFCGTADEKAPRTTVLGFNDGASIATVDAPEELVGTITPDPSGIESIELRFTKSDGTAVEKRTVTRRVCRKVKGKKRCSSRPLYKRTCRKVKGKRRCTKKKVVKVTRSKVPLCLTVSGTKNYFVKLECAKVKWFRVDGDSSFRYSVPVALGTGAYTVDAIATDGAGNKDVLEPGRNHMTFKVVNTPSNAGGSVGNGTGPTTTTPTAPIDDTGSPFG